MSKFKEKLYQIVFPHIPTKLFASGIVDYLKRNEPFIQEMKIAGPGFIFIKMVEIQC